MNSAAGVNTGAAGVKVSLAVGLPLKEPERRSTTSPTLRTTAPVRSAFLMMLIHGSYP